MGGAHLRAKQVEMDRVHFDVIQEPGVCQVQSESDGLADTKFIWNVRV